MRTVGDAPDVGNGAVGQRRCISKVCGKVLERRPGEYLSRFNRRLACDGRCARQGPRRQKDARLMRSRYRQVAVGGRRSSEHRLVVEALIGRPLRAGEQVHHINHDGLDNRPENLQVLSALDHGREHKQVYPASKACGICGSYFAVVPGKFTRSVTCSSACFLAFRREAARAQAYAAHPAARARHCVILAEIRDKGPVAPGDLTSVPCNITRGRVIASVKRAGWVSATNVRIGEGQPIYRYTVTEEGLATLRAEEAAA